MNKTNYFYKTFLNLKTTIPFLDQMLVSGSHFVIQIIVARALGIQVYGVFTSIWLALLFISTFHTSFINSPMLSINQMAKIGYYRNLNFMQWIINVIIIVLIIIAAILNNHFHWLESNLIIYAASVAIIGFITHDFYRKVCYAKQEFQNAFVLDILVYGLQLVLFLSLLFLEKITLTNSLAIIGISYLIGSFTYILINFFYKIENSIAFISKENIEKEQTESFLVSISNHWKFSNWLLAKSGLQWLSGNLFLIAAGTILGTTALGSIRMAQNIIGIFNVLLLTIENTIPAKAAKILKTNGINALKAYFKKLSDYGSLLIIAALILLATFAQPILQILYKDASTETVWIFRCFCLLYFLVFHATLKRIQLRTLMNTKQIFIAYLISAIISIVVAYPLINLFKISGVMIGIIASQFVSLLYYIIYLNKKTELNENYTFRIG